MIIIGIDPGLNGAIALTNSAGWAQTIMPTVSAGKGNEVNASAVADWLSTRCNGTDTQVFLEKVKSFSRAGKPCPRCSIPCQICKSPPRRLAGGATQNFKFGENFGVIKGVIGALKLPLHLVTPQNRQKVMHAGVSPELDPKQRSRVAAMRLFPGVDFRKSARCKNPHDGLIDATLIAAYGLRRMHGGR